MVVSTPSPLAMATSLTVGSAKAVTAAELSFRYDILRRARRPLRAAARHAPPGKTGLAPHAPASLLLAVPPPRLAFHWQFGIPFRTIEHNERCLGPLFMSLN
jgi:hypothetical protein